MYRNGVDDFKGLVYCQFLQQLGTGYRRVANLLTNTARSLANSPIIHADLAAIAEDITQELNSYQRSFLHMDYVVPLNAVAQIDEWQVRLEKYLASQWDCFSSVSVQRQALLEQLSHCSPQDAYYRDNDSNVMLQVRAWRPKLEILLPWKLRQQMIREVKQELSMYSNE